MKPHTLPTIGLAVFSMAALLAPVASAQTWNLGNTGGDWSTAGNWNPATAPGSGNTADLTDVTSGTRTIIYDAGASGALGTLNVNQSTSGGVNILEVQRALTVANAASLGAAAGTERLYFNPTAGSFTYTGNLTLNANGELYSAAHRVTGGGSVNTATLAGSLTIAGGSLVIQAPGGAGTANSAIGLNVSNGLTMTSGSISIDNSLSGVRSVVDIVNGLSASGGTIGISGSGGNGAQINLWGATNTLNVASFDSGIQLQLSNGSALMTLATNQTLGTVTIRYGGANLVSAKQITSTASGNGIGSIYMNDSNNGLAGSAAVLKLGSNLASTSGAAGPTGGFSDVHESGKVNYGVDLNGFTFDHTGGSNSGKWTPNKSQTGGVTSTVWDITSSSGTGTFKAGSFNFNTADVTTNVGNNVVLLATGGNSTANDLGGTGTIDSASVFRYSGTATTANPATLTSNRAIGKLEVTSGALRLLSSSGIQGATTVSAGTLILASSASLGGTPSVTLGSTGALDTSAQSTFTMLSDQPFTFTIDPASGGTAGMIIAAGLDITNATVNFATLGTLDDPVYILASYTSLTGSSFGSVSALPSGYTIDYNYLGTNQIALVPEPATWAMLTGGLLIVFLRRRKQV